MKKDQQRTLRNSKGESFGSSWQLEGKAFGDRVFA